MNNEHSHHLLWAFMFLMMCGVFNDCNTGLMRLDRENAELRARIERLESR